MVTTEHRSDSATCAGFGAPMRREFAFEDGVVYLTHGSFGATPRRVLAAQSSWRARMEAQPFDFLVRELPGLLGAAAADLAAFVGSRPEDLVFAENATTAINAVVHSLALGPGDQLLCSSHAHAGSRRPLQHAARKTGAHLVEVDVPFPPRDADQLVEVMSAHLTPRTRLAVFDHISSPTAIRFPIEGEHGLVALCRERGIPVLVDGAHTPGHIELDVASIGADYYVGGCHKWLFTPRGCAFLWAREPLQATLHPAVISDGYSPDGPGAWAGEFHWVGTRDPTSWLSVSAAIAWLRELGPRAVRVHNHDLCEQAALYLVEHLGLEWGGVEHARLPLSEDMRCAMMTLPLPFPGPADPSRAQALNLELWQEHRMELPIFAHDGRYFMRISAQIYNALSDYQQLAEALTHLKARG